MAALRCDLSGDPTSRVVAQEQDTTLNAFLNSDCLRTMMQHLKFEEIQAGTHLPGPVAVLSNKPDLGDLDISSFHFDLNFAQFDLSLHLYEQVAGSWGGLSTAPICSMRRPFGAVRTFQTLLERCRGPEQSFPVADARRSERQRC